MYLHVCTLHILAAFYMLQGMKIFSRIGRWVSYFPLIVAVLCQRAAKI